MNETGQKLRRIFQAACAALVLTLPFAGAPGAAPAYAERAADRPAANDYRPIAGMEPKADMDRTGAACAGKAELKPAVRISGGRGGDSRTCLRAAAAAGLDLVYISCTFVSRNDTPYSTGILAQSSHGCRAPPAFSPRI
jgi:hypothetical protein